MEWNFQNAWLLNTSEAHPVCRFAYILSEKKADVFSSLKAEVYLPLTQSPDHMQTDGKDPSYGNDEVTAFVPSGRTTAICNRRTPCQCIPSPAADEDTPEVQQRSHC